MSTSPRRSSARAARPETPRAQPDPPSTPTTEPAPLDRTLTYRLHLLHKLSDRASHRAYPRATRLSMSEGRCLASIGSFEPLSVVELAQAANLDKGQASRAAQALVAQGLVRKQDSAADGRGVVLTLSASGRAAYRRTTALIDTRNAEIFGCLSASEQQVLGDLLDRLIDHNRR